MDDERIVELYWSRSEDAITETSKKYGIYCQNVAYGILRNIQDAEECVQDTWLRAWNSIPPHRPMRLAAFLAKITRNLSLDRYRKNHAVFRGGGQVVFAMDELRTCVPFVDASLPVSEDSELTESLERFLFGLSKEKRQVFMLRYWYFRSIQEIMEQLNMSKSKVSSMLFRTRKELKTHLEQEGIHL